MLTKMILEVNNTFGERRVYLLDPAALDSSSGKTDSTFRSLWEKDFHVSPFNSRKGSYTLKAANPFPSAECDINDGRIDNTIVMQSSKGHAKIVARVFSTGPSIKVKSMTLLETLRFISGWWWVGLLTFPRILKEAFRLFFHRKLHVWYRPEILASSIGRLPSPTERYIAKNYVVCGRKNC